MTAPAGGKPIYARRGKAGRLQRLDVECWQQGCKRPRTGMWYCQTHTRRMLRGLPMDAPIRGPGAMKQYGPICDAPGCDNKAPRSRYCMSHQRRAKDNLMHKPVRRYGRNKCPCGAMGCDKPRRALRWCSAHYKQRQRLIARYGWMQWPTRWHASDPLLAPSPAVEPGFPPLLQSALNEFNCGPRPLSAREPAGGEDEAPLTRAERRRLEASLGYVDD